VNQDEFKACHVKLTAPAEIEVEVNGKKHKTPVTLTMTVTMGAILDAVNETNLEKEWDALGSKTRQQLVTANKKKG
jgi:hypothetical protein